MHQIEWSYNAETYNSNIGSRTERKTGMFAIKLANCSQALQHLACTNSTWSIQVVTPSLHSASTAFCALAITQAGFIGRPASELPCSHLSISSFVCKWPSFEAQ
eukprot:5473151-Amphidinium_carterae.2